MEISNLVNFQPSGPTERCSVTEMIFCQPADVIGAPLTLSLVSVANGPLSVAISWQIGALDLHSDEDEVVFVRTLCQKIDHRFTRLASTSRA